MKHNKDSNSTNGFNKKTAIFQLTKKKMKLFLTIIFTFKIIRLNTELLLQKSGNLIHQRVLSFLNFCYQLWTHGELNTLQTLFLTNQNQFTHQLPSFKMVSC